MNKSMVRYLLSKLLLIEASLMLIPVIVAFIYHEDIRVINSLVITIGMLVIIGLLGVAFKPKNYHVYTKEGLLIVALCWILWSFFGACRLYFQDKFQVSLMLSLKWFLDLPQLVPLLYLMLPYYHTHYSSGEVSPTLSVVWGYWCLH